MTFPLSNPWTSGESVTAAKLQARITTPINALYALIATTLASLPAASKSGSVTITPVANTPTSGAASFPAGRFTVQPAVTVGVNSSAVGTSVMGVAATAVLTTGCTIWVYRSSTSATTIFWIAQQDSS